MDGERDIPEPTHVVSLCIFRVCVIAGNWRLAVFAKNKAVHTHLPPVCHVDRTAEWVTMHSPEKAEWHYGLAKNLDIRPSTVRKTSQPPKVGESDKPDLALITTSVVTAQQQNQSTRLEIAAAICHWYLCVPIAQQVPQRFGYQSR